MRFRYLIIPTEGTPFFTHWCDCDKFPQLGGQAFDLENEQSSTDGINWKDVELDHL